MQANVDNEGQLSTRFNYRWSQKLITKTQIQIAPGNQAMAQFDNEYVGDDFTASIKTMNPSALDGGLTGIYIGSYMQSVTPSLALGLEAIWQRQAMSEGPQTALSYAAKYRGSDWLATAQLQAQGAIAATFWRRLSDRVEVGAELNLAMTGGDRMMGPPRKEGVATVGAKYEFRMSTFRAQVDSTGKLSCLMEKRVAPPVQLTFAAEIDHAKVCPSEICGYYVLILIYRREEQRSVWQSQLRPVVMNFRSSKRWQVHLLQRKSHSKRHLPIN